MLTLTESALKYLTPEQMLEAIECAKKLLTEATHVDINVETIKNYSCLDAPYNHKAEPIPIGVYFDAFPKPERNTFFCPEPGQVGKYSYNL